MGLLDRAVDKLKEEGKEGLRSPLVSNDGSRRSAGDEEAEASLAAGHAAAPEPDEGDRESPVVSDRIAQAPGPLHMGGRVKLDLAGMARRGYVVPGYPCDNVLLDEYRRIKRQLLFKAAVDQADEDTVLPSNLIMVTSAIDGEGKTFVSTNLAFSVSQEVDRTALLVDGDVVRRGATRLLGLERYKGLIDYLTGDVDDVMDLMVRPEGMDNLLILPAGTPNKKVNELLASERMQELMETLARQDPDRIAIFDTPPLLMTSESHVLMQLVGQVAMVVRADETPQHHVEQALGFIPAERFSGLILNGATRSLAQDGYASYYYGDD
ncbi:MAG: hypothetical protein JJT88_12465 [Gammaproteobacteria bacterium]|nr:hypothetical protein [Gammaproteobacteria bacterium]